MSPALTAVQRVGDAVDAGDREVADVQVLAALIASIAPSAISSFWPMTPLISSPCAVSQFSIRVCASARDQLAVWLLQHLDVGAFGQGLLVALEALDLRRTGRSGPR